MNKTITYGIYKNVKGRFAVTTDISDDKTHYTASYDLTYANADFALRKAESFVKHCYKDFINFQGILIHFRFKNMGCVNNIS